MRVALLTTGKTELLGLLPALSALFPGHQFEAIQDRPGRAFVGFTSVKMPLPKEGDLPTTLDILVAKAVELIDPIHADPYDLAVVFEDLELVNRSNPELICVEVREAVKRHIDRFAPSIQATLANAVRDRLSFHLAAPMIESWFFGAPSALTELGVQGAFHKRGDPEEFEATDNAYIAATSDVCAEWCRGRPKKHKPKWVNNPNRKLHPKGYLQWLLLDPKDVRCTHYMEGQAGRDVLSAIHWDQLLQNKAFMPFARSLVDDLADGLGQAPALSAWAGVLAPQTCRTKPQAAPSAVLRNL